MTAPIFLCLKITWRIVFEMFTCQWDESRRKIPYVSEGLSVYSTNNPNIEVLKEKSDTLGD